MLSLYPSSQLYLDLKITSFQAADSIVSIMKRNYATKRVIVASSNFVTLSYIKHFHPSIITCLEGFKTGHEWHYSFIPKRYKPDYLSSFINEIDSVHIDFLNNHSLLHRKIVYGVDSSQIKTVKNWRLDKYICDLNVVLPLKN